MIRRIVCIFLSFVLLLCLCITPTHIKASEVSDINETETNITLRAPSRLGGKYQRGVKKMYYTINDGAKRYSSQIKNATHNWVYTGYDNPIYMYLVTSTYATDLDFYTYSRNNNIIGETRFFSSIGNRISPNVNNWYFAQVYMNSVYGNRSYFNGTIRHEIGHALGLGHTFDKYSIMCQTGSGRKVQTVQKSDSDMIVKIYGW
ncbi:MAG: matrixin family metalloprotease [Breznakia sp.]